MQMRAQWLKSWACMLEGERNVGGLSVFWGNLLSLVATAGHVLTAVRADTSLMERGKKKEGGKIPSSSLWLRWDPMSAFIPVCL